MLYTLTDSVPNGAGMQAIGYVRVSTAGQQAAERISLAAQRARIDAWAASRGVDLISGVHANEGISGQRVDDRPGLRAALDAACRAGAVLVAYDLTRLARSTRDAIDIAERLQRAGAQLSLTSGDIDTTTPSGEFVFTFFAALSSWSGGRPVSARVLRLATSEPTVSAIRASHRSAIVGALDGSLPSVANSTRLR